MSNHTTISTSLEKLAGPIRLVGVSDDVQKVGGKGLMIRAPSSPKQGEEAAGLDALQFDEDSLPCDDAVSCIGIDKGLIHI